MPKESKPRDKSPQAPGRTTPLGDLATTGLEDVPEGAVGVTGYLVKHGNGFRLYPTLDDRSRYSEFEEKDAVAWTKWSAHSHRVTVWFPEGASIQTVQARPSPARFLAGDVAARNMARALPPRVLTARIAMSAHSQTVDPLDPRCWGSGCKSPSGDIDPSLDGGLDCF